MTLPSWPDVRPGRLAGASLRNRPAGRRWAAWVLAAAGPAVVGLGLLPLRGHIGLAALLFSLLLPVVAAAVIGGTRPALTAVVVGFLTAAFLFAPPYGSVRIHRQGDLIAAVAFVVVGATVGSWSTSSPGSPTSRQRCAGSRRSRRVRHRRTRCSRQ